VVKRWWGKKMVGAALAGHEGADVLLQSIFLPAHLFTSAFL
jgi:hypothetical protein